MKILILGGAGFVGSFLARSFKKQNQVNSITVFDNLRRRGSEINLSEFKCLGIDFVHGDIRQYQDLLDLNQTFDLVIDASAEPSVLAGITGNPGYVLQTNLVGTLNGLEFTRNYSGAFLFLSTSRVYSMDPLKNIRLTEDSTRFEIHPEQTLPGISLKGISEDFPTHLARSLYGASKLSSEIIAQEYANTYNLKVMINRCGVIAGPGQFGKVDQGVFTLWVMNHIFKRPLKYLGYGGTGKQVRDLLHPQDLFDLIHKQLSQLSHWNGQIFNIGGGRKVSVSMQELTQHCQEVTKNEVPITKVLETSSVDIPLYLTDSSRVRTLFDWEPQIGVRELLEDTANWVIENRNQLQKLLL